MKSSYDELDAAMDNVDDMVRLIQRGKSTDGLTQQESGVYVSMGSELSAGSLTQQESSELPVGGELAGGDSASTFKYCNTEEVTLENISTMPDDAIAEKAKSLLMARWNRCVKSYVRDFMVENSDFKREQIERPGVPPMRMRAFGGCAAILRRRIRINAYKHPVMRLYKCVDLESVQDLYADNILPQQSDDLIDCIVTCTDLTLEKTMLEQFSSDDSRFNVFIVDPRALIEDCWVPLYDRGYVYWHPPAVQEYLYGAPEFSSKHVPEQCIDY